MNKKHAVFSLLSLAAAAASAQQAGEVRPELSGLYQSLGFAVQPCGRNEWMLRSFETDQFCLGSDAGFPFTEQGRQNWASFNPIDDPILGCIETFPRSSIRGRPFRLTVGATVTELAYWFGNQWHARTIHRNGPSAPAGTPHTRMGYSVGRWSGDTLIVETTHTVGGPMFNDHKPYSRDARFTERFWKAPDGRNLLMDIAIDDPVNYAKPFVVNRQERVFSPPDFELSDTECEPITLWLERQRQLEEENPL